MYKVTSAPIITAVLLIGAHSAGAETVNQYALWFFSPVGKVARWTKTVSSAGNYHLAVHEDPAIPDTNPPAWPLPPAANGCYYIWQGGQWVYGASGHSHYEEFRVESDHGRPWVTAPYYWFLHPTLGWIVGEVRADSEVFVNIETGAEEDITDTAHHHLHFAQWNIPTHDYAIKTHATRYAQDGITPLYRFYTEHYWTKPGPVYSPVRNEWRPAVGWHEYWKYVDCPECTMVQAGTPEGEWVFNREQTMALGAGRAWTATDHISGVERYLMSFGTFTNGSCNNEGSYNFEP